MIKHPKLQCQPEYNTNSNNNNITTSLFGLLTARGGISQPRSKVKLTLLPSATLIKTGRKMLSSLPLLVVQSDGQISSVSTKCRDTVFSNRSHHGCLDSKELSQRHSYNSMDVKIKIDSTTDQKPCQHKTPSTDLNNDHTSPKQPNTFQPTQTTTTLNRPFVKPLERSAPISQTPTGWKPTTQRDGRPSSKKP
jgi:hypothetical protein